MLLDQRVEVLPNFAIAVIIIDGDQVWQPPQVCGGAVMEQLLV